ncbi:MAG: hypothetical protein Q7R73_01680 [bacterium]|nr:hypothetical protein [bacterium]
MKKQRVVRKKVVAAFSSPPRTRGVFVNSQFMLLSEIRDLNRRVTDDPRSVR